MKKVCLLDRVNGEMIPVDDVGRFILDHNERARLDPEETEGAVLPKDGHRLVASLLISGWAMLIWDGRRQCITCEVASAWRPAVAAARRAVRHFSPPRNWTVRLMNYRLQQGVAMPCGELLNLYQPAACSALPARALPIAPRSEYLTRKALAAQVVERISRRDRRDRAIEKAQIEGLCRRLNAAPRSEGQDPELRAAQRLIPCGDSGTLFLHPDEGHVAVRSDRMDSVCAILGMGRWALLVVEASGQHPAAGLSHMASDVQAHGMLAEIVSAERRHVEWIRLFLVKPGSLEPRDFEERVRSLPSGGYLVHLLLRAGATWTLEPHAGEALCAVAGNSLEQLEQFLAAGLYHGRTVEVLGTYRNLRWSMLQPYPRILTDL